MTIKEILIAFLLALLTGILIVHYEKFIDALQDNDAQSSETKPTNVSISPQPPPIAPPLLSAPIAKPPTTMTDNPVVTHLKKLQIPNALLTVQFWLDTPGKTQFSTDDRLTLYYKVSPLTEVSSSPVENVYFSLFNVAPTSKLSILLENEEIEIGQLYSLPKPPTNKQVQPILQQDKRLGLEPGYEYFKAIVTFQPITSWLKFLATDTNAELERVLGTKELSVTVQ